jgi:3-oxoacyl-[acyl-carrier-protein] synthase II
MSERRVVITGIGVLTPLGSDLEVFWQNLLAGKSGIGPVTRFDTTAFDCKIGGEVKDFNPEEFMPIKEDAPHGSLHAICHRRRQEGRRGLHHRTGRKQDVNRIGVLIGSGIGGMETIENQVGVLLKKGPQPRLAVHDPDADRQHGQRLRLDVAGRQGPEPGGRVRLRDGDPRAG